MKRGWFISGLIGVAVTIQFALAPMGHAANWTELPAQDGQPRLYISVTKAGRPGTAPVALMLHGSSGMTRPNTVALDTWAEWFAKRGIASVIIDSYRGRGLRGDDDVQDTKWVPIARGRVTDVKRALAWLPSQDWADPGRAFIFGLSNGGSVGIYSAVDGNVTIPQIHLYPYCSSWLQDTFRPKAGFPPSLWLSGDKDAISLLSETRKCVGKINAAGGPGTVKLVVLPGAQHAFDRSPRERTYSEGAVEASKTEIEAFLKARALMQ